MNNLVRNSNTPELRFPEFRGEWQLKRITDLGDVVTGSTPSTFDRSLYGDSFNFVSPGDMNAGRYVLLSRQRLSEKGFMRSRKIPAGSTLFVCIGSTIGKTAQVVAVSIINQQINAVIPNSDHDKDFVYFVLAKASARIARVAGEQAVPIVSKAEFQRNKISIPPLAEQQKIAAFLTAVDKKLAAQQHKINLLKQYKKGVAQALFSQKVRFKDEHSGEFPEWTEKLLKNVAVVNPKATQLPDTFRYIDLENVVQGKLLQDRIVQKATAPSRAQRLLHTGDILFQTVRPYQRNNLLFDRAGDYVASTGYAQLRARQSANFLYHFLHTDKFVTTVLARCSGTSYPAIAPSDLANIPCLVPTSLEEQQKIAGYLTALDDKISLEENKLEQAKRFKKGLLQGMFV